MVNVLRQDILPVPYFHFVFTLPNRLLPLIARNEVPALQLVFRTAWRTLLPTGHRIHNISGGSWVPIMVLHT